MIYEIEATIVRTSIVAAGDDEEALQLALEDLRASMAATEIHEEDLTIVSRSSAAGD